MNQTSNPYAKDASGAGRFTLDVMKKYRKWVSKGDGTLEEWEACIAWTARWACHWAKLALSREVA